MLRLLPDERLARMAEAGSTPAFAAIYTRHARALHGYCRSIVRDEDDAVDALQTTMLKALAAMRRSGRTGPLRPWLFRIAHNECVTLVRQRSRRPDLLEEAPDGGAGDPHRHADARERLGAVLTDLEALSGHQRGALVMRELAGLGYDEIALALETSPLAARQAVHQARRSLRARGRVRGHLALLLPPAPAGGVLAAVLATAGGGSAGASSGALAVKIVSVAAAVTVGVGSAEVALVHRAPPEPLPVAEVARAAEPARARAPKPVAARPSPAPARRAVMHPEATPQAVPQRRETAATAPARRRPDTAERRSRRGGAGERDARRRHGGGRRQRDARRRPGGAGEPDVRRRPGGAGEPDARRRPGGASEQDARRRHGGGAHDAHDDGTSRGEESPASDPAEPVFASRGEGEAAPARDSAPQPARYAGVADGEPPPA